MVQGAPDDFGLLSSSSDLVELATRVGGAVGLLAGVAFGILEAVGSEAAPRAVCGLIMLAGCLVYGMGEGLFIRLATVSLVGFVLAFASYFLAEAYGNLPPQEETEIGETPVDLIFALPVLWVFVALGRSGRLLVSALRRPA